MTEIVKDVQYALQNAPGIQALVVAPYLGEDAGWVNGWIFDYDLQTRIENSQRCAIVVRYLSGLAPDPDSTFRTPIVVIDIWADPTRKSDNSVKFQDAAAKCFRIYDEVFKILHRTNRDDENGNAIFFNETLIATSESLGEPELNWVADGNGARMLRGRFELSY